MQNKKHLLLILPVFAILFSPLFFSSCKQPDDLSKCDTCLTPFMTPGFACRINGKPFIAKFGGGGFITTRFDYYKQNLHVRGNNSDILEDIGFNLSPLYDTGLYYFPSTVLIETSVGYGDWYGNFSYKSEPIKKGYVHITRLDSVKMSVAGKFEFELYSDDFKDTVRITDGRFFLNK